MLARAPALTTPGPHSIRHGHAHSRGHGQKHIYGHGQNAHTHTHLHTLTHTHVHTPYYLHVLCACGVFAAILMAFLVGQSELHFVNIPRIRTREHSTPSTRYLTPFLRCVLPQAWVCTIMTFNTVRKII
jgi:hypothetical protein